MKTGTKKQSNNFTTIIELLRYRAKHQGDKTAYIFLADGENEEVKLTYEELDKQARAIAAELQKNFKQGDRALMLYPPGMDFISAFFGCLYAGVIAVPCYPPDPNKLDISINKLRGIMADCSPKVILTTKEFFDLASFIFPDYPDLEQLNWMASDKIDSGIADNWKEPVVESDNLSFIQYTSGSTGDPKGVMVSHGNILHNEETLKKFFPADANSATVGWLPMYHDMGLIGNILQPLYSGYKAVLMSPIHFLQKPLRWLKAISKYKGSHCPAPNFAYDLCVKSFSTKQLEGLDLSSWSVAINGAEPVKTTTIDSFIATYQPYGFKKQAFSPAYGMAETTLIASGIQKEEFLSVYNIDSSDLKNNMATAATDHNKTTSMVSCGGYPEDQQLVIVDPEALTLHPENKTGEIWISGPSVAQGYWNKPELTKEIFQAFLADTGEGPFLRTGDLGFMKDGELFVTGRVKDLIIIRGQNHYPHDIELTVEQSHESLRPGCAAAFSVDIENEERLVVVQELKPKGLENLNTDEVIKAARQEISKKHELQTYSIILIEAKSIPKTSSGKIQRRACKQQFLEGSLNKIADWKVDLSIQAGVAKNASLSQVSTEMETERQSGDFKTLLEILRYRAEHQGDKTAYIFLADGENEELKLTYAELDKQAKSIAAELQKDLKHGDRALLIYPPGLDFIYAFFGCLYAGVTAVPCYPPDPNKLNVSMRTLQAIIADCEPGMILTNKEFFDLAAFIFPDYPDLKKIKWMASDTLEAGQADDWKETVIDAKTLAFLQYTSGSTGAPKGVMISHENIIKNLEYIRRGTDLTPDDIGMFWLPSYHDMGLINGVINPVYTGMLNILMSPMDFLKKPIRWLKAVSRYKATYSGGPNFAYDLCANKIKPEDLDGLNLSSWRCAFSGAEAIRKTTLNRFEEVFKSSGFQYNYFYPCYGLAEVTVAASGGFINDSPIILKLDSKSLKEHKVVETSKSDSSVKNIISCGHAWPGMEIIIVDPETMNKSLPDTVGEIWIKGDSVAQGYWNKPDLTKYIFQSFTADSGEGPFMRTEDLGFMKDGELFLTGRIKDLIIIRGRNHYPQDIEFTAEQSHPNLRPGCGATFSVEVENEERLVVVQEVKSKDLESLETDKIIKSIRQAVVEKHELQTYSIILVEARNVPKTSSGKIQRRACKQKFLDGKLKIIAEWKIDLSMQSKGATNTSPSQILARMETERQASDFKTLLELLLYRAKHQPDRTAYIFLVDGETEEIKLTYEELEKQSKSIAAELQKELRPGDRALLLYPPGMEFITAFFGCIYAGVIAVPCYPPDPNKLDVSIAKLQGIIADSAPEVILTTKEFLDLAAFIFPDYPDLEKMKWLASDTIDVELSDKWKEPVIDENTLAFIQYTSGSTGNPKGVMISHGNLLYNSEMMKQAWKLNEKTITVCWLPLYHDMGLIGNALQAIYSSILIIIMSPIAFLQKPIRWLKAIERYKATDCGAPNFAYDLLVRDNIVKKLGTLDLSSWVFAINAAEAVRHDTLKKFNEVYAPFGFSEKVFYPCYGIAEATVFVAGGLKDKPPVIEYVDKEALKQNKIISLQTKQENASAIVGCGRTWLDQKMVIVNPEELSLCSDGQVGEIWLSGPNIAQGYWNNPELTKETFQAFISDTGEGPFLRTGDMGFMKEEELFITGRVKDLIIIRGQNHYPHDIELTAEQSHESLRPGCSAAFSVEIENEERLVMVQEVKSKNLEDLNTDTIIKAARQAIAEKHELQAYSIVLIEARSIPKTSSGKIQRSACKQNFLDGDLKLVTEWKVDLSMQTGPQKTAAPPKPSAAPETAREIRKEIEPPSQTPPESRESIESIQRWIITNIAGASGIPVYDINIEDPFSAYGLDSVQVIHMVGQLEEWLEKPLSPTLMYNYPTILELSQYLSGEDKSEETDEQDQNRDSNEAIAVVGMSCRLPKADSPDEFWKLLINGVDAIREIPAERWNIDEFYDPEQKPGKMNTRWGGFLEHSQVEGFDAPFFGISPREAETMDPQQRLLMQVSWEALESAGLTPKNLRGSKTGVFTGICSNDYFQLQQARSDYTARDAYTGTGNAFSIAANRLSWFLDLRGPSLAVDTACSSSLVAVHQACRSLRQRESDMALASGVNLMLTPDLHIIFSRAGMMSKDGRCKTFDASADGYVRGEGCGVVVLKRLSDAIENKDNIMAVIKGSAINQDGRTSGLTAPNGPSQEAVIRKALEQANVKPSQISFVETHGTGTSLGDPIEVESLKEVLTQDRRPDQTCFLGAAKTNIGHLEGAAGIAGLIKTVLCLRNKKIPGNLHFRNLNPLISIKETPLKISTELRDWPENNERKLAGVSSFGFGGANAHIVLEEYLPEKIAPQAKIASPFLIVLSAKDKERLKKYAQKMALFLEESGRESQLGFELKSFVEEELLKLISEAINIPAEEFDAESSFEELGIDLINLEKCRKLIEEAFELELDSAVFTDNPSLKDLSDHMADAFSEEFSALVTRLKGVKTFRTPDISLADLAWTLQTGREAMKNRLAIVANSKEELLDNLKEHLKTGGETNALYIGDVKKDSAKNELLVGGKAGKLFLQTIIEDKDIRRLANLWTSGVDIDWNLLYGEVKPCRISIPVYPFAKKRYWIPESTITSVAQPVREAIHPLLDANISSLEEQSFEKKLAGDQFYLNDHRIKGEMIFPGAAYLEMARAAGELSGGRKVTKIKNLLWTRPLRVGEESEKIKISIYPADEAKFLWQTASVEQDTVYSQGELEYESTETKSVAALDLESIKGRCSKVLSKTECYQNFEKVGLNYGPAFQTIEKLVFNENEALGHLKLSEFLNFGFKEFDLHPSLLDGALQTVTGLLKAEEGATLLPFSLKETLILKPLENEIYAYATFNPDSGDKLKRFNISLCNQKGEVLVVLNEFVARAFDGAMTETATKSLCFEPVWRTDEQDAETEELSGNFLIFDNDETFADAFKKKFPKTNIDLVKPEESWKTFIQGHSLPDQIIYLWGKDAISAEEKLTNSFYSPLELSRDLIKAGLKQKTRLIYLYGNNSDQAHFDKAVGALAKTATLEQPRFLWKTIGFDNLEDTEAVLDKVSAEFADNNQAAEVRYQGERREIKAFEEFDSGKFDPDQLPLKTRGVYLITGGLGGLGLIMAEYLAKNRQAKLVLSGRSELNPDMQKKILTLEKSGAEVIYLQTHISDAGETEKFIEDAKKQFGEINGVIHSAGISIDGFISDKTKADADAVLAPKIQGALNLDQATKDEKLDLMVFFSSIAGALGNAGQSDYAYANCFLDNLSERRNQLADEGKRFGKTVSINWPYWAEGGMKINHAALQWMKNTRGMFPLTTKQGLSLFEEILTSGKSQMLAVQGVAEKLKKALAPKKAASKLKTSSKDQPQIADNDLHGKLIADLTTIAARILKVEEEHIDADENISAYGFDSISFTELTNELNQKFGLELSPPDMFEHPSVNALKDYLLEEYGNIFLKFYKPSQAENSSTKEIEIEPVVETDPIDFPTFKSRFAAFSPAASSVKTPVSADIAVVGMAARLPGAVNLDEFWLNLENGKDCITEIPTQRWDWRQYGSEEEFCSKWGGFVTDVDKFDAGFFNISRREAELMDPQHRIFLEVVWETIEDSGYKASDMKGSETGLFVGVCGTSYYALLQKEGTATEAYAPTGLASSVLANRVSYLFDWRGPSEAVDTACSSSMVALHRAVQAIKAGDCENALVGGVNLILNPDLHVSFSKAGMLSEDGRCKTFDERANGYVRGEGVGAVLLKPLDKALENGDRIYGVIKGSAVNHGGQVSSLTVPSPNAQSKLLVKAHQQAKTSPDSVGYIECHGTGTALGDPIEINGLKKAFKELYQKQGLNDSPAEASCALGSAKTNIGHLEGAAGITGVIKTLLALSRKKIPRTVHFEKVNPYIELENTPFYISLESRDWIRLKDESGKEFPLRAGVSSFGFGGSNAHVVLEEYQTDANVPQDKFNSPSLIVLSAKNKNRLKAYAEKLAVFLEEKGEEVSFAELSYTLQIGREAMEERLATLADDTKDLLAKLKKYLTTGEETSGLWLGNAIKDKSKSELLVEGEEGAEFIDSIIKKGKLPKLARLWVGGVNIDWNLLYGEARPRRASLPYYPFADERYWTPKSNLKSAASSVSELTFRETIHPLVDSNISTLAEQAFSKELRVNQFYLNDHRIMGKSVFPAAGYMEMARAAGELAGGQKVGKLKNMVWLRPLQVDTEPKKVKISIYPEDAKFIWRVADEISGEAIYSEGELEYISEYTDSLSKFDIENIKKRCSDSKTGDECYRMFEKAGLNYGPAFQMIENLASSDTEALSKLKLPDIPALDFNSFALHPVLMDGALQTVIGLFESEENEVMLPFALKELEIIRPLEKEIYAYATFNPEPDSKLKHFDIRLLNMKGEVLASMNRFSVRSFQSGVLKPKFDNLCFEPLWQDAPIKEKTEEFSDSVLILDTDENLFEAFKRKFPESKPVLIKPEEDYQTLTQELVENKSLPDKIIYLWGKADVANIEERMDNGFYGLFGLGKALINSKVKQRLKLLYLYQNDSKQVYFDQAITAVAKTMTLEKPRYFWKTMGLEDLDNTEAVLDKVSAEFADDNKAVEVRYQGEKREIKVFHELGSERLGAEQSSLKQRGIYLITGGLGGLGLIMSRYLAKQYQAKLILAGRSELNQSGREKLSELEKAGADAIYIQADVSNLNEVEKLILEAKERFGAINGIIHSAGINKDSLIFNKTKDEIKIVMAPKVQGTLNLDQAAKDEKLDFMVFFSSIAGVTGNVGQAGYAYANSFMDNVAAKRNALMDEGKRFGKTISINWSYWSEGGMEIDQESLKWMENSQGLVPLSTDQGLKFFEESLLSGKTQTLAAQGKSDKLKERLNQSENKQRKSIDLHLDDDKKAILAEKTIKWLKVVLSTELKLAPEKIKKRESWENYGIDSVMILSLVRRLEKDLGELSKTLFFEYQNLEQLSLYLIEEHPDTLMQKLGESDDVKKKALPVAKVKEASSPAQRTRFVSVKTEEKVVPKSRDIAMIGLNGRYPQADNLKEFWENLKAAKDCIVEIPSERWDWGEFYNPDKDQRGFIYNKWGGFLNDIETFDPQFFNISPRDAQGIDPQERLFLQTVWHTLEDAGYSKSSLLGSDIGVFVGLMWGEYQLLGSRVMAPGQEDLTSSSYASVANRVSYFFDWHGPSMALDSMCSSSLTAIQLACDTLRSGSAKMAIAGGVNLSIDPYKYLILGRGRFAASDGRCRSFGVGGDGYVPGEGVGAVLLKPLEDAVKDGDHIYGVIKGGSLNHGGKTAGYTVPNPISQGEVIRKALDKTGVEAESLNYIEAHGTGTSLGDPIEINGLKRAFETETDKKQFCPIGSVKSNIGHLESAAGIAALSKVVLQLKHKQLVPSIHSDELNPNIKFEDSPFYVQRELSEWRSEDLSPLRAGISSFGAGGSNAHLIIEEYQDDTNRNAEDFPSPCLIVLSAKKEDILKTYAEKMVEFLEEKANGQDDIFLPELAWTLQVGREPMKERLAMKVETKEELLSKLREYLQTGEESEGLYLSKTQKASSDKEALSEEEEEELIQKTIKNKQLDKLTRLWVNGSEIDWKLLYGEAKPRKISLPVYPFAGRKYWFGGHEKISLKKSVANRKVLTQSPLYKSGQYKSKVIIDMNVVENYKGDEVLLEIIDESIALVIMQDRENRNMFSENMVRGLTYAFSEIQNNKNIKVVVLTGYDEVFCMGGAQDQLMAIAQQKAKFTDLPILYKWSLDCEVPVIAAIQGHASGGGLLFGLYSDIILMSEEGVYSAVFMKYGFTPGMGATLIMKHKLGNNIATEMMFSAGTFSGKELKNRGASVIFKPKQEVLKEALSIAGLLAQKPRNSLAVLKQELASEILEDLDLVINRENEMHAQTFSHPDVQKQIKRQFRDNSNEAANEKKPLKLTQSAKPTMTKPTAKGGKITLKSTRSSQPSTTAPAASAESFDKVEDIVKNTYQEPSSTIDTVPVQEEIPVAEVEVQKVQEAPIADTSEIQAGILQIMSDELYLPQDEIELDTTFNDLGMDSISGVTIINEMNTKFSLKLNAIILYEYPTVSDLTSHVVEEMSKVQKLSDKLDKIGATTSSAAKSAPAEPAQTTPSDDFRSKMSLKGNEGIGVKAKTQRPQAAASLKPKSKLSLKSGKESAAIKTGPKAQPLKRTSSVSAPQKPAPIRTAPAAPQKSMLSLNAVKTEKPKEVAIIGMSGRFPDAENIDEFWNNLENGVNSIREVPKERWNADLFYDENPQVFDKSYSKWGAFLQNPDKFDPLFFNISPQEALSMDPQQRLFLEESWKALEDAGYSGKNSSGTKTGVFVGATIGDYEKSMGMDKYDNISHAFTGLAASILASRISYFLDLKGPAISMDTACSSSLVAVHQACQSILNKESDMALAGGAAMMFTPDLHIKSSNVGMLSPTGQCRPFDQNADGIALGEAVGVVVLKELGQAIKDGDRIYGVIKGSGINQDGRSNGITAPSAEAQKNLELEVYSKYGINPETISYIETHGTGTILGDPIEVRALKESFKASTSQKHFCALGSVKANIGHTTMASGVSSLIKTILMLKNKKIPPVVNFENLNEYIELKDSPFYINTETTNWSAKGDQTRRAAISSFGFSGTNAHMVIEEYKSETARSESSSPQMILLSAKNDAQLKAHAENMVGSLESSGESVQDNSDLTAFAEQELLNQLSDMLNIQADDLERELSFEEQGMDILSLDKWRGLIDDDYGLKLETSVFAEYPSLKTLSEYMAENFAEELSSVKNGGKQAGIPKKSNISLSDLAYTLQTGRDAMEERLAILAKDKEDVVTKLTKYIETGKESADLYLGNVRKDKSMNDLLIEGEAGDLFIKTIIKNKQVNKLARLWVSGVEVEWKLLHDNPKPSIISLPAYPFERNSYWAGTNGSADIKPKTKSATPQKAASPEEDASDADLEKNLKTSVSKILGIAFDKIDEDIPLAELGLDSIMMTTLVDKMNDIYKTNMEPAIFYEYFEKLPTLRDLIKDMPEFINKQKQMYDLSVDEDKSVVYVVDDLFDDFAARGGKMIETYSSLLDKCETGTVLSKTYILGHGLNKEQANKLRDSVTEKLQLAPDADALKFEEKVSLRIPPALAGRKEEENIMICDLRQTDENKFMASMIVDKDCLEISDHLTGTHLIGLMLVETTRQMAAAALNKYVLGDKASQFALKLNEIECSFKNYLFPLDVDITMTLTEQGVDAKGNQLYRAETELLQNGDAAFSSVYSVALLPKEALKKEQNAEIQKNFKYLSGKMENAKYLFSDEFKELSDMSKGLALTHSEFLKQRKIDPKLKQLILGPGLNQDHLTLIKEKKAKNNKLKKLEIVEKISDIAGSNTNKRKAENIIVTKPVSTDEGKSFISSLIINNQCAEMRDPIAGKHIEYNILLEAARQMAGAIFRTYGADSQDNDGEQIKYSFVFNSININFQKQLFPFGIDLKITLLGHEKTQSGILTHEMKVEVIQMEKTICEMLLTGSGFPSHAMDKLETDLTRKICMSFFAHKNQNN